MNPKPETRKMKTPATTHPIGDTKSAVRSRLAMARMLGSPVGRKEAYSESAVEGCDGSASARAGRLRGGGAGRLAAGAGRAGGTPASARAVICFFCLARAF